MTFLKSLSCLLLAIMMASCASVPRDASGRRIPKEKLNETEATIERAKGLTDAGEVDAGIAALSQLISNVPYSRHMDEAYELLVRWLLLNEESAKAKRIASQYLKDHGNSACATTIINLFNEPVPQAEVQPKVEEVIETPPPVLEESPASDEDLEKLFNDIERNYNNAENADEKKTAWQNAHFFLQNAPISFIERKSKSHQTSPILALLAQTLALHHLHRGLALEAQKILAAHQSLVPDVGQSSYQEVAAMADFATMPLTKTVGIVLPLSGPLESFGERALMAIKLGLGAPLNQERQFKAHGFRFVVADSKGEAVAASTATSELLLQHKPSLIMGDMVAEASLAVAALCRPTHVPQISLARHPLLKDDQGLIFQFVPSYERQIEKLVSVAMKEQGHKRFGILYPRNNYGITMANLFFASVINLGGQINALVAYDSHETNFTDTVARLVGKHHLSAREDYKTCLTTKTSKECAESLPPAVDFEALFIADFKKTAFIIPALAQADVLLSPSEALKKSFIATTGILDPQPVQILGAASFNQTETLSRIAPLVGNGAFVDAVDYSSPKTKSVADALTAAGQQPPQEAEIYAHDAGLLVQKFMTSSPKVDSKAGLKAFLQGFSGEVGALGTIGFNKGQELLTTDVIQTFGQVVK